MSSTNATVKTIINPYKGKENPMPQQTNPTLDILITRLPATPTVTPEDIAAAVGHKSSNSILRAISAGKLSACRIGGRYIIARPVAIAWLESTAVVADEAE